MKFHIAPEITFYNAATWNKSTNDSNVTKADGSRLYTTGTGACLTI